MNQQTKGRFTNSALSALALACAIAVFASPEVEAKGKGVSQGKVLGACGRTAGCKFHPDRNGNGWGCSPNVCFICNNGKCTADMKGKPGRSASIGGVTLPINSLQPASGKPGTVVRQPVHVGLSNESKKINEPTTTDIHGGMKQGGRRH